MGPLIVGSVAGVVGLLVVLSGLLQPAPSLERMVSHLQRPGADQSRPADSDRVGRFGRWLAGSDSGARWLRSSAPELRLIGRTPEQHAVRLVTAAAAGFFAPLVLIGVLQSTGAIDLRWFAPLGASLVGAVAGPALLHTHALELAAVARTDMRYELSAYLDVVAMLLAGNSGYEGALEQAARVGDGRMFVELRRRIREAGALGASLTDALDRTGRELGLAELEQIAATCALSASEGAPVARTLAAKCATLRTALATEQEAEARLRTSRLTTPIVGMALIFMALVIYPALSVS